MGNLSIGNVLQINGNGFRAAIGAANRLNTGIDVVNAWAVETILTFILVLVVFSATDSAQAVKAVHLPVSHQARQCRTLTPSFTFPSNAAMKASRLARHTLFLQAEGVEAMKQQACDCQQSCMPVIIRALSRYVCLHLDLSCFEFTQALAPFAIGTYVFLAHLVALPIDGCRYFLAESNVLKLILQCSHALLALLMPSRLVQ